MIAIPLARWADRQLKAMARAHGLPALAALEGATLMGERGANGGYTINGPVSAGLGGSRLLPTRDGGWFALTLIRGLAMQLGGEVTIERKPEGGNRVVVVFPTPAADEPLNA